MLADVLQLAAPAESFAPVDELVILQVEHDALKTVAQDQAAQIEALSVKLARVERASSIWINDLAE